MDQFKELYQSEVQKLFVHSELTDPVTTKESDFVQEVLAQEWCNEMNGLEYYLKEKVRREYLDNIPRRKDYAETASNITKEEAIKDLREHGETPFLFRKYMIEFWKKITAEWESSRGRLTNQDQNDIMIECGRHVKQIMKWDHCGRDLLYDPTQEWTWDAYPDSEGRRSGRYALKIAISPVELWGGHIKYPEIPQPYNIGL